MSKMNRKPSNSRICVLCGKKIVGWANNAYPLAQGKCCQKCDEEVLKERIRRSYSVKNKTQ